MTTVISKFNRFADAVFAVSDTVARTQGSFTEQAYSSAARAKFDGPALAFTLAAYQVVSDFGADRWMRRAFVLQANKLAFAIDVRTEHAAAFNSTFLNANCADVRQISYDTLEVVGVAHA
jgi:hypothetical protein